MRKKIRLSASVLVIVILALAGVVLAQGSSGADFIADKIKFNYQKNVTTFWGTSEKPVSVQVDKYTIWAPFLEYHQDTGKVIASGGVKLVGQDPQLELLCDQVEAAQEQILATGKVTFEYAEFTGTGEKLIYLPQEEQATLDGNPVVKTPTGAITGSVIEIDLANEEITASGGSKLHLAEVE